MNCQTWADPGDITPEEIQRVAQQYLFPDRYSPAIAGPAHSDIP